MVQEAGSEAAPRASGSYFTRHWRGELSLARSWWMSSVLINGLGVGLLFAMAANVTIMMLGGNRPLAVILLLFQIGLTIVSYIWALVGTWRAAGRHPGSKFWPIVARILMALGVFVTIGSVAQSLDALSCYASSSCELTVGRQR